jgi:glycosyltransferase involved in cell wall biosynthesis
MRIAQFAPISLPVPPKKYGGVQRGVWYLTEELVAQGHEVTLFARSDSTTSARLISACGPVSDQERRIYETILLGMLARQSSEFDVVHFHTMNDLHLPLTRLLKVPSITTTHITWVDPALRPLLEEFSDVPAVSMSDAQRRFMPQLNWLGTVYYGFPPTLYALQESPGRYLAYLGLMSREKGADQAIEIAKRTGMKLILAGCPRTREQQEWFDAVIKPQLRDSWVEYIGEIGNKEKQELLGNAYAFLFPIDLEEAFGQVMVEAMACGTPVIAYCRGSVPEVVDEGVTGFVVKDVDGAVEAVGKIGSIDRRGCREMFDKRFAVSRMAQEYLNLYGAPSDAAPQA